MLKKFLPVLLIINTHLYAMHNINNNYSIFNNTIQNNNMQNINNDNMFIELHDDNINNNNQSDNNNTHDIIIDLSNNSNEQLNNNIAEVTNKSLLQKKRTKHKEIGNKKHSNKRHKRSQDSLSIKKRSEIKYQKYRKKNSNNKPILKDNIQKFRNINNHTNNETTLLDNRIIINVNDGKVIEKENIDKNNINTNTTNIRLGTPNVSNINQLEPSSVLNTKKLSTTTKKRRSRLLKPKIVNEINKEIINKEINKEINNNQIGLLSQCNINSNNYSFFTPIKSAQEKTLKKGDKKNRPHYKYYWMKKHPGKCFFDESSNESNKINESNESFDESNKNDENNNYKEQILKQNTNYENNSLIMPPNRFNEVMNELNHDNSENETDNRNINLLISPKKTNRNNSSTDDNYIPSIKNNRSKNDHSKNSLDSGLIPCNLINIFNDNQTIQPNDGINNIIINQSISNTNNTKNIEQTNNNTNPIINSINDNNKDTNKINNSKITTAIEKISNSTNKNTHQINNNTKQVAPTNNNLKTPVIPNRAISNSNILNTNDTTPHNNDVNVKDQNINNVKSDKKNISKNLLSTNFENIEVKK